MQGSDSDDDVMLTDLSRKVATLLVAANERALLYLSGRVGRTPSKLEEYGCCSLMRESTVSIRIF